MGILSGCFHSDKPNTIVMENKVFLLPDTFIFYKDKITGLCFASIHSNSIQKFERTVCVPCDSLKNVQVHLIR